MTRQVIIERTLQVINQLPEHKAEEISEFADFLMKRYEEQLLSKGMHQLYVQEETFSFLHEEEETYTVADLKEVYRD